MRSYRSILALACGVMAAPQAFAYVDQFPSIIKVGKGEWTVTKACPANVGKCKIYDTEPKYFAYSVRTTPLKQLKEEGSKFTFAPNKKYWIVFFPKESRVAVKLEFAPRDKPDSKSTFTVTGTYLAKWLNGPKCEISSPSPRAVFANEYFAMENPVLPWLTLKEAKKAKDTSAEPSVDLKGLREFEMTKRMGMGLKTPDPLGSAPEGPSDYTIAPTARDYWRLDLAPNQANPESVRQQYRKMQKAFHPDHNLGANEEKATEISKRIVAAYERIKRKLGH